MNWNKQNKYVALTLAALFVATGIYNTVVISSESHLDEKEVRFVKRLDEIYGVTIQGRAIATTKWEKLTPQKLPPVKVKTDEKVAAAPVIPVEEVPEAVIQDQLTLSLVEVINPKKQDGVKDQNFSGNLLASNGVIEELSVSLPDGQGVSVSFSELSGNVFEYDLNGEQFSGMMYQVDQHAYMVTFTNGPLEGTRLRFSSQDPREEQIEVQNTLADNNVELGNFGEASPLETQSVNDVTIENQEVQAQGFNFDQQVI